MKNFNKLYYVLTFTWGIIPNIIGMFIALFFKIVFKSKSEVKYGRYVFVGGNTSWGGLSMGNFVFMCPSAARGTHTICHEIGHSLQNIIWGPLWIFAIGIPSFTRYWYRETPAYMNHPEKYTDYDAIWFEGQATKWGTQYVAAYEKSEEA
jgi:hypothetical protein